MKVLVAGATGAIGCPLVSALLAKGTTSLRYAERFERGFIVENPVPLGVRFFPEWPAAFRSQLPTPQAFTRTSGREYHR